jgi:hypothetical protein
VTSAWEGSRTAPATSVHLSFPTQLQRLRASPIDQQELASDSTGHSFVWTTVSPEGDCVLFTVFRRPLQHS